jgi:hypothetical protein
MFSPKLPIVRSMNFMGAEGVNAGSSPGAKPDGE